MAVLSDGHGGSRYFRSDKGSEIAVKITKKIIEEYLRNNLNQVFNRKSGKFGVNPKIDKELTPIYESLNRLISAVITRWNKEIIKDAEQNPLNSWELEHVEQKYIEEFNNKIKEGSESFEKFYGCTLMAFVMTDNCWFAFQIGDGKMLFFFRDDETGIIPQQPVPWDERCFLNKTTSICDSDAVSEFRFAFSGKGDFPLAVFLGSDGIDDTYGDGDKLTDFYIRLYKEMVLNSSRVVEKMLEEDLPYISKTGSKDDMSIALVYEKNKRFMDANYLLMSKWQIDNLTNRISNIDQRINELNQKVQKIGEDGDLSESQIIELNYTKKDIERAREEKRELESNISKIQKTDELFKASRIKDQ